MKKLILFSITLLFVLFANAQLFINAGNDTIMCVDVDTIQLGATPTALGGSPPYNYTWETSYTIGVNTFYASTFLNDTTSSNPILIAHLSNQESLIFKLTLTDNSMNSAIDSVVIRFSEFYSTLNDNFATINQGDSVQLLHTIGGGISPFTYQWSPNYNLSDYTAELPWAKPDTTTFYVFTITDSTGCQTNFGDIFEVYVNPSVIEKEIENTEILVFPNPTSTKVFVEIKNEECRMNNAEISVFDIYGKEVLKTEVGSRKTEVDLSNQPKGIYVIKVRTAKGVAVEKVVLE